MLDTGGWILDFPIEYQASSIKHPLPYDVRRARMVLGIACDPGADCALFPRGTARCGTFARVRRGAFAATAFRHRESRAPFPAIRPANAWTRFCSRCPGATPLGLHVS